MGKRQPKQPRSIRGLKAAVEQYLGACDQDHRIPTVTGLALALGFSSREEMEQFSAKGKESVAGLLEWARSLVEEATLQAVYRKDTSTGARFILQTSFGYGEKNDRDLGPITVRVEGEEG